MDDNIHLPKNRRSPSTAPNRQRSQPQDINVAGASNIDPERNLSPPIQGYVSGASQSPYQPNSPLATHSIRALDGQAQLHSNRFVNLHTKNLGYSSYLARQSTYNNFPHTLPTPDSLAEAGFYFSGNEDIVICYQCNIKLKNWHPTNDPWLEHVYKSGQCDYLCHVKGKDFILYHAQRKNSAQPPLGEQMSMPKTPQQASALGATPPNHPEYKTEEARMKTLEGVSFANQTHKDLSEAGLFYQKAPDYVKCFQCGVGLRNWLERDTPLISHLRLSPHCSYLHEQFDETSIRTLQSLLIKEHHLEVENPYSENTSSYLFENFQLSSVFKKVFFLCNENKNENKNSDIEKSFIYHYFGRNNKNPNFTDMMTTIIDLADVTESEAKQSVIAYYKQHQENIAKTEESPQEQRKSHQLKLDNVREDIRKTFLLSRQHMEEKQKHHEKQDAKLARRHQDAESKATNISPQPYPENSQLIQDEEIARQLQNAEIEIARQHQEAEMAHQSQEADDPRDNEPSNESK